MFVDLGAYCIRFFYFKFKWIVIIALRVIDGDQIDTENVIGYEIGKYEKLLSLYSSFFRIVF